jgi:solute carrier family 40 (iron-regulated transporter), member 1
MFDLACNQLLQERVVESERGVVNGTQSSLNMVFETIIGILGVAVGDPSDFPILVAVSFAMVGGSAVVYALFYLRHGKRGGSWYVVAQAHVIV